MSDTASEVDVVVPNLSLEESLVVVEAPEWVTTEDVRAIGYPRYLFEYTVSLERAFLSDRIVDVSVTVDAVTGGKRRNDAYPDIEKEPLSPRGLITDQVDRDTAEDKARAVVRRYISFHYPTWVLVRNLPPMEITKEDFVYTIYWLIPDADEDSDPMTLSILDTISGKTIKTGVQIDEVSVHDLQ